MAGKGRATYEITVDTKGAQADLDGLVRGGAQKFEKLSGAINAATGQLGGLGGVAGKTLGTMKQFGEAFLVGGPVGIGLAAGAVAVGLLVEKFSEGERAVMAFRDANRRSMDAFVGDVEQAAFDAEERLRAFGRSADEMRAERAALLLEAAVEVGDDARTRAKELREEEERYSLMLSVTQEQRLQLSIEDQRAFRDELKGLADTRKGRQQYLAQLDETADSADKSAKAHMRERDALAQLIAKQDEARKKAGGRPSGGGGRQPGGPDVVRGSFRSFGPGVDDNLRLQRELEGKEQVTAAEFEEKLAEKSEFSRANTMKRIRMQAEEDVSARRVEIEKRTADEISRIHQGVFSQYVDLAQGAVLSVSGMFFDSLEALAAGQKVSFEEMAAGFIRNIGEQLVAIGVRNVFEGAGYIASGVATSNPQLVSGGASLVAAGIAASSAGAAMAASGAVAQGAISARSGGASGSSGGTSAGRVSSRRSGANGDGGDGMSVTYVLVGGTILGDPGDGMRRLEQRRRRELRSVHTPGMA